MFSTYMGSLCALPRGLTHLTAVWRDNPMSVAPYVPSPIDVVRKMLKIAEVGPEDVVYDLGCGDGRILFEAVQEFGASRAVGYDLNKNFCERIRKRAAGLDLQDRIQVVNGNFFLADLSPATVITLYLTTSGNSKLRPKFEKESCPGTRIVSHDFPIKGWTPCGGHESGYYIFKSHKIYLYRIPEAYKLAPPSKGPESSRLRRIRSLFRPVDLESLE